MKRRWGDWLVVVLGALLAARTGGEAWRLYKTGGRLDAAQSQVDEAKRANGELRAKLEEVQSLEFVEREAREKLGYGRPGEEIVILPEQNDSAKGEVLSTKEDKSNWQKWWDLYIRL